MNTNEPKKKKLGFDYWIIGVLMVAMVVVVMIQVTTRLMGVPIMWGEELARWILIWIVFGGLGYAFRDGGLISVDFFVNKFKPRKKKVVHIVDMALTIVYFVILLISSVYYFMLLHNKGQTFPVTGMPATFTVAAMLLGCVLAIIFAAQQIKSILKKNYEDEESEL